MHGHLIASIQSLIPLQTGEEDLIKQFFKEAYFRKGELLLAEGSISNHVLFINQGLVRYFVLVDGEEKTYAFGAENAFSGNYESFLTKKPSKRTIQALEDCFVLQISYENLQQLFLSLKQGERFGRLIAENLFLEVLEDLTSFYTETPEERYEKFLIQYTGLHQRIAQYHIASYLGIQPQSLSRIRKRITKPR